MQGSGQMCEFFSGKVVRPLKENLEQGKVGPADITHFSIFRHCRATFGKFRPCYISPHF
jgi:hypothetical protein